MAVRIIVSCHSSVEKIKLMFLTAEANGLGNNDHEGASYSRSHIACSHAVRKGRVLARRIYIGFG